MRYMGSKNRIANRILPIILSSSQHYSTYVEPFAGGMNTIGKVYSYNPDIKVIANDINHYLISMFNTLINHPHIVFPKKILRPLYNLARQSWHNALPYSVSPDMVGYNGEPYIRRGIANLTAQVKVLQQNPNITYTSYSYKDLPIPDRSIIYCDPPYKSSKAYSTSHFNHSKFWQWCKEKSTEGHEVFVSERTAPDFAAVVWQQDIVNNLSFQSRGATDNIMVEKLFHI